MKRTKNKLIALLCFLFPLAVLAQTQSNCNVITYGYDANGERLQRILTVQPCGGEGLKKKQDNAKPKSDSISAPATLNIKAYPNPSTSTITIEITADQGQANNPQGNSISSVKIFDLGGREIFSRSTTDMRMDIDVSGFSAGSYTLQVLRGSDKASYVITKN